MRTITEYAVSFVRSRADQSARLHKKYSRISGKSDIRNKRKPTVVVKSRFNDIGHIYVALTYDEVIVWSNNSNSA